MSIRLFKVGADPEFGFIASKDKIAPAHELITPRRAFGLDGCEDIAELRPAPSINPSQVVRSLHQDMVAGYYANPSIRRLYWKAGNSIADMDEGSYSIGGHIHLGLSSVVRGASREDVYLRVTDYLDTYLLQVVGRLELPSEVNDRVQNDYGHMGDIRTNNHGLEYRTLGSWLTSPRVAEGVLCLAQTVSYQCLVDGSKASVDRLSPRADCDCSLLEEGGCTCSSRHLPDFKKAYPEVKKRIRRMKLYKRHELPIEFLFTLIEKEKTWFPGKGIDIKAAWGISYQNLDADTPAKILPVVKFNDIWERARN